MTTVYERVRGLALPGDRCALSCDGQTCVAASWHDGEHEMVPLRWLVPWETAPVELRRRIRFEVKGGDDHKHTWGPYGCWCGAQKPIVKRRPFDQWARQAQTQARREGARA